MKNCIISLFLLASLGLTAQDKKKSFFQTLKGEALETSISFLPFGTHYTSLEFNEVWYTTFNYKSIELIGFKNSFNELAIGLSYKREIGITQKLTLIYGIGIMYGYHGKLIDVPTIPFRNTFLFKGEINPLAGLTIDYRIAEKFSFQLALSPAVGIYGFRYFL
jgi:hypothetical protein|tara:strand:+ start:4739 stop:5227 length:489 start_codon:yes stop_codon:yes gene_type:complete